MKTSQLMQKCEAVGLLAFINRIGRRKTRRYEVIINFEVKKIYRQRQSAIRFIHKLLISHD